MSTVLSSCGGTIALSNGYVNTLKGSPVILEGNTPIYRWGSRVSIYTGLPTILGWDWHQTQQRWGYPDGLHQRKADVTTLYSTTDITTTLALLHRYQVEYVYVGELERLYYPVSGIDKFHTMTNQGMLQAIYQNSPGHHLQGVLSSPMVLDNTKGGEQMLSPFFYDQD